MDTGMIIKSILILIVLLVFFSLCFFFVSLSFFFSFSAIKILYYSTTAIFWINKYFVLQCMY